MANNLMCSIGYCYYDPDEAIEPSECLTCEECPYSLPCEDDYSKMNICGNCKNYYVHGVMGFDGQSFLCKIHTGEKEFDQTCKDFEQSKN